MIIKDVFRQLEKCPISSNRLERWMILFLAYYGKNKLYLYPKKGSLEIVNNSIENTHFLVKTNITYLKKGDSLTKVSYDKITYNFDCCKHKEDELLSYFLSFSPSIKAINIDVTKTFKSFRILVPNYLLRFILDSRNGEIEMAIVNKKGDSLEYFNFKSPIEVIDFCEKVWDQRFEENL